jgi:hypothetical protein
MADELGLIASWLYSTLSADDDLVELLASQPITIGDPGIFRGSAKQGAVFPFVLFKWRGPVGEGDFITLNGERIWTRHRYEIIAATDTGDYEAISPIASEIDDLLHRSSGDVSGGHIYSAFRETPIEGSDLELGTEYKMLGALWRITVTAT